MASIYQSSHITIVAASAKNADEGFLQPRKAPSLANTIPFMHNGSRAGTVNIRRLNREVSDGADPRPSSDPVDSSAWTLQEQLLSQRLLVYSTDTLQWRCKGVVANLRSPKYVVQPDQPWFSANALNFVQPYPAPLLFNQDKLDLRSGGGNPAHDQVENTVISLKPSTSSLDQQELEPRRIQRLHEQWTHLIEIYSMRSMKYASDKLVALASIAQRFGDSLRTQYVAGLWEVHMLENLMWRTNRGATEISIYRAPSWSWASLDGRITFDQQVAAGADQNWHRAYDCRILRCQIILKDQLLPHREVNGGHIELSAVLRRAWYGDPLYQRLQLLGSGTTNDKSTYGRMDMNPSWYNGEVFCVALWVYLRPGKYYQAIEGLMLTHKETNIYERLGWFESYAENFDGFPIQTITII